MKKIFYFASIAALAFSSCTKDDTTGAVIDTVGGAKITAAVAADETRTSLDENKKVRWEAGDMLGVYTVGGGLNNAAFVLDNGSHESAVGVFNSQSAELKADKSYIAVYPRFQEGLFSSVAAVPTTGTDVYPNPAGSDTPEAWDVIKSAKYEDVVVKIPATQKYRNGSFYTQTVPSVSSKFVVDANGEADVTMQPVVDYLAVDIQSVEPIHTLSLSLGDGTNRYILNGEGNLSKYVYNGEYRYMLDLNPQGATTNSSDEKAWIKIEVDEEAANVMCHSANTYVFTVPANILRKNEGTIAVLRINEGTPIAQEIIFNANSNNAAKKANWQLNYAVSGDGYKKPTDAATEKTYRKENEKTNREDDQVLPLENSFFWMNERSDKGAIKTIVYNPNNTFIIEHEGHLLQYLTEYGNTGEALNQYEKDYGFGFRSAIICAEHTFDFSKNHIENMSDILEDDEYSRYERYFSAYLNGSFPVIDYVEQGVPSNVYKHTFTGIEYGGKMPVITGIYQPLAGMNGIFGQITGKVSDVSFSGIKAKVGYLSSNNRHPYNGLVLGSIEDGGSIANITVDAATGSAILNKANNAAYEALTITNAQNLNYIALDMDLTKDLEIKNWNAVSVVKNKVFGSLMATDNDGDSHHVVKLPSTAAYAKLSQVVGNHYSASNIFSIIAGKSTFRPVLANVDDLNVVSVLVGEKSYWTGDKFDVDDASYHGSVKLLPATYTNDYKIGDINVKGWFKLEYAEQLATGANEDLNAVIMRDMELGYAVNPWEMVTVNKLHGNGATVSNLYMAIDGVDAPNVPEYPDAADYDTDGNGILEGTELTDYNTDLDSYVTITNDYANTGIAPVDAKEIRNLTVDGITLDIYTEDGTVVPGSIGGLALDADRIYNVTVKNLVMTGDGGGKNDEHYVEEAPVFIGWLVANSVNTTVENSNVAVKENTIKGYAGLVGKLTLTDNAGANIKNSKATITKAIQTPLTTCVEQAFADWAEAVYSCTPVAYVKNVSGVETTINMKGSGAPAFVFYAPAGDPIYVINDGASLQLKNTPAFDYPWSF